MRRVLIRDSSLIEVRLYVQIHLMMVFCVSPPMHRLEVPVSNYVLLVSRDYNMVIRSNIHSNYSVIASGGKHAGISRVPRDRIDTARQVTIQCLHKGTILFMPDVDPSVCE